MNNKYCGELERIRTINHEKKTTFCCDEPRRMEELGKFPIRIFHRPHPIRKFNSNLVFQG